MIQPRLLLIDSSHQSGFVAIAEADKLLAVRRLEEARRHARDLAPAIHELFTEADWKPRDVTAVIVGLGPGSYTGLRVGVMSAKTLAYATGCRLIGLETFAVIAAQAGSAGRLAVIADAQQNNIYVQEFENRVPLSPLRIQQFQPWLETMIVGTRVSGPGLGKWVSKLPTKVVTVDSSLWDPLPETLLQLGLERYRLEEWSDVWTAEPIYLRPSAAEEQLAKRITGAK